MVNMVEFVRGAGDGEILVVETMVAAATDP